MAENRGTCEIHITVDPTSQSAAQVAAIEIQSLPLGKGLIRPRLVQAAQLYGEYPLQPMFSCFLKSTVEEASKKLIEISTFLKSRGVKTLRNKLETGASNPWVPNECESFTSDHLEEIERALGRPGGEHYFEFHFDIPIDQTKPYLDWNSLVDILIGHGCHLSHNLSKGKILPIATIRDYTSFDSIVSRYDKIKFCLEVAGYKPEKLQREYSIFDDAIHLDKGWLFDENPKIPKSRLAEDEGKFILS